MATKFADQVKGWTEKAKQRQLAIFRESTQKVMEEANTPEGDGGKMPVDTSFLRNSVAASTEGPPDGSGADPSLVFASVELGETVWAGWTAAYAMRMEHGFYGEDSLGRVYAQDGKGFMRSAAQNWIFIVDRVTKDVRERIK